MRPHIWPGLSLAGGVVIAAIVVLLVISGGGNGPGHGSLPPGLGPGDTQLYPHPMATQTGGGSSGKGASRVQRTRPPSGPAGSTSDAAAFQYGAQGTRGTVLGGP